MAVRLKRALELSAKLREGHPEQLVLVDIGADTWALVGPPALAFALGFETTTPVLSASQVKNWLMPQMEPTVTFCSMDEAGAVTLVSHMPGTA